MQTLLSIPNVAVSLDYLGTMAYLSRMALTDTTMHEEGRRVPLDTFAARLAVIRIAMGWSGVEEAAEACGINRETWRGWEKDGRMPRDLAATARRIEEHTGYDATWVAMGGPLRSRCFMRVVPAYLGQLELAETAPRADLAVVR